MNKAIVVKATGEILFEGTYDECRASMRPAFMKHIDEGNDIDVFPLRIVGLDTEISTNTGLRYVNEEVGYVDEDEEYR